MPVRSLRMLAALVLLGSSGCGVEAPGGPEPLGRTSAAANAYSPMGFARVSDTGKLADQFNSAGGVPSVTHPSAGLYTVSFPNLATGGNGHAQVTAEGGGGARCRLVGWAPNGTTQQVTVQCNQPVSGAATDSPFSVVYFRYTPPTQARTYTEAAYVWVYNATVSPAYSYNSSGATNTVVRNSVGVYTVTFPNASSINASLMVTAYGGSGAQFCQIGGWGGGPGTSINAFVQCWNSSGTATDSDFALSYSVSGPVLQQQSAHAWFSGSSTIPAYSSTTGHISGCSNSTISGSRTSTQANVTVQGDLGPWDSDTFRRASFASGYGSTPIYCKLTWLTTTTSGTNTTASTGVKCADGSGAEVLPSFTFTHITSDVAGPC